MLARRHGARPGALPLPRMLLVALVTLVALVVAACGSTPEVDLAPTEGATDELTEEPATEETTEEATEPAGETEEAANTEPTEPRTDEVTEATEATDDGEAVLEDGRHPVLLTELDPTSRSVTFDLIQFLTGPEAADAYAEDVPEDPDPGPPNDYWIRNVSSQLRTLPIADDVAVSVIRLGEASGAEGVPWTLEQLPAHLAEQVGGPDDHLGFSPWWLTVEDGVVVAIDEQYTP
jgi:hypothetical protein